MKEKIKDSKILIAVLVSIIILLLIIVAYAFIINPAITSYVIKEQSKGYEYAIIQIAQQASTCKQVPLIIGNQTINIIDVRCLG